MQITQQSENGYFNIIMKGDFTFDANVPFRDVLDKLAKPDAGVIVIDLSGVEFMDSAALGMLLLAHERAGRNARTITLKGARGHVKKILQMARFDQFFVME